MTAPSFILVNPQMGENIGAAARVMGNFGLTDLRIVDPRDGWPNRKAEPLAAGSPVLKNARMTYTLDDGVGDLTRIYATTARPRDMVKPVMTARAAMTEIRGAITSGETVGILFGAENSGLPNEAVASADAIITLPVDREFSSLNLAQTVGVLAHEWRAGEPVPEAFQTVRETATKADLERLFEHFEAELDKAGFFYPPEKTPLMVNNLRAALSRASFTEQEARTFRGAIKALALGRGKARIVRDD